MTATVYRVVAFSFASETKHRATVVRDVPVVLLSRRRKEKKRGGRKYSGGFLYPAGVAEHRILSGFGRTANDFRKRSERSAQERRDGALHDLMKNTLRSLHDGVGAQVAKMPEDVMRSRPFKDGWRTLRRMTRFNL